MYEKYYESYFGFPTKYITGFITKSITGRISRNFIKQCKNILMTVTSCLAIFGHELFINNTHWHTHIQRSITRFEPATLGIDFQHSNHHTTPTAHIIIRIIWMSYACCIDITENITKVITDLYNPKPYRFYYDFYYKGYFKLKKNTFHISFFIWIFCTSFSNILHVMKNVTQM